MFCPKCGKESPEGSAFCPSCGAALPTATEPASAPTTEAAAPEAPIYELPGEPADSAPAPVRVAPAAPPAAPEKPKKRSKKPLVAAVAVVLVAAAGFSAWRLLTAKPAHVAEQNQGGTAETVYEDFEVGEVRLLTDGNLGPRLEVAITNNTGEIATDVGFDVTGDIAITDEYGDEGTVNADLDLVAWEPGVYGGAIAYLQPGENTVTIIPEYPSGVVASYTPDQGDTQEFQLDEVENIEFEVGSTRGLGSGEQLLTPEDCGVEIELSPDGSITGSITNNTDVRWRRATVHLRAENADGTPATIGLNESTNDEAFNYGEITVEYVRPGETVDLEKGASMYYDPARVVATYVVIEEDV